MKILWLCGNPSLYVSQVNGYGGGGWIGALESMINKQENIELGVSFVYPDNCFKKKIGKTTYYPLNLYGTKFSKIKHNLLYEKYDEIEILKIIAVIKDFKPEIIHVWGTEISFGLISKFTTIPTIIHIQGILNPIFNALYIPGINRNDYVKNNGKGFFKVILNNHILKMWKHNTKRELEIFKINKYFLGRTNWDKNISSILAKELSYFHSDEILRLPFYKTRLWQPHNREKMILTSVLSNPSYKGIDLVLKCAKILKENIKIEFEWHIIGVNESNFAQKFTKIKSSDVNVIHKGILSAEKVIENLINSDLFIHTSYIDNSPNSVCEAQIIGIPVISTNVGGITSLIQDNISGLLVPSNDPYYLVSKIVDTYKDKDKSISLGKKAHEIALERHDQNKIVDSLKEVYRIVLEH